MRNTVLHLIINFIGKPTAILRFRHPEVERLYQRYTSPPSDDTIQGVGAFGSSKAKDYTVPRYEV